MASRFLASLILTLVILGCQKGPNERTLQPISTSKACIEPPAEFQAKARGYEAIIDIAVKDLGEVIKGGSAGKVTQEFERIRKTSPLVENFEVLDYRFCAAVVRGDISKDVYSEFLQQAAHEGLIGPPREGFSHSRESRDVADEHSILENNIVSGQDNPIFPKGTILTTTLKSEYTIHRVIHSGVSATLFLATDTSNKQLALKVYWRNVEAGSSAHDFFVKQYDTKLPAHRNIVRVIDRGIFRKYPYVVMEYYSGGSLEQYMKSHDRIPGPEIMSIVTQLADAIDFANSHGILHRDIKPSNVLFETDAHGRIALGDFDTARYLGAVETRMTVAAGHGSAIEIVGSPAYLAPEIIAGKEVTTASDIYSFGVVLYEMIANRTPFDEFQNTYSLLLAKTSGDPPDIRKFRPVPEAIGNRLAETLNRDPKKRPKSARAVLSGIESQINKL